MDADDKSKIKFATALVGLLYVFVIIPIGLLVWVALGKVDQGFAATIFQFISTLSNSPAGQFLWGSSGDAANGLNIPY